MIVVVILMTMTIIIIIKYGKHHHNFCNHQNRFISDALLYDGIWEEGIVTNVLKALELYPVKPLLSSVMSLPST